MEDLTNRLSIGFVILGRKFDSVFVNKNLLINFSLKMFTVNVYFIVINGY